MCLGLLGYALYLQHLEKLDPCPWCIAQRLLYIAVALVALVAALHRPGRVGTMLYAVFGGLFAATGIAAAIYQIQLQNDPQRALECMGSWLERWLDTQIRFDRDWEAKVVEAILRNLSVLFDRPINTVHERNRYRKSLVPKAA